MKKKELIAAKKLCNDAKVGEEIICPSCRTIFTKKSYNSVFCKTKSGTKCKDYYWNNVDENKRKNTTRISPASARYMSNEDSNHFNVGFDDDYNPDDDIHPHDPDALGQWND